MKVYQADKSQTGFLVNSNHCITVMCNSKSACSMTAPGVSETRNKTEGDKTEGHTEGDKTEGDKTEGDRLKETRLKETRLKDTLKETLKETRLKETLKETRLKETRLKDTLKETRLKDALKDTLRETRGHRSTRAHVKAAVPTIRSKLGPVVAQLGPVEAIRQSQLNKLE